MSPTSRELIINKPLAGTELSQIILSDAARMLESNGLLSGQIAYGRVSYSLRLTIHLDNPAMRESSDTARSRPRATDTIAANPALAAIEAEPPLSSPSPDAVFDAFELQRDITSPNLARVEFGLPVDVAVKDQDGHHIEHAVTYPPGAYKDQFVEPELRDVTPLARLESGIPPEPPPRAVEAEDAAALAEALRGSD